MVVPLYVGLCVGRTHTFEPHLVGIFHIVGGLGEFAHHLRQHQQVFVGGDTPAEHRPHGLLYLLGIQVPANQVETAQSLTAELPGTLVDNGVEEGFLRVQGRYIAGHIVGVGGTILKGTRAHLREGILGQSGRTVQLVLGLSQHQQHVGVAHQRIVDAGTLRTAAAKRLGGQSAVPFADTHGGALGGIHHVGGMLPLAAGHVAALVVVGERDVVRGSQTHLVGRVTVGVASGVRHTDAPAHIATHRLYEGHFIQYLGVVLHIIGVLVGKRSAEVVVQLTGLQLDELLAVVLGHLNIVVMAVGSHLLAVQGGVGHAQTVGIHVQIVVGTLHLAVEGLGVAGAEQGQTGYHADGEVAVHTLYAAGVHVRELHARLYVHQLLKDAAVNHKLVGAGLVKLAAPLRSGVVVGHVAPETAHQIVAVGLDTDGLALHLLHLVARAYSTAVDAFYHLVGTVYGLQVVVPHVGHVVETGDGRRLERPYGTAVAARHTGTRGTGLNVGVLHVHTAHTRCVGVLTEKVVGAIKGLKGRFGAGIDRGGILL